MGQKVNPTGLRLGIIKGWDSNWYGGQNFSDKLVEDQKIRKYVYARIPKGGISRIIIERTLKRITLTIHTARPGVVIGKGGAEVDKIKEELKKITNKDVQINIFEIKMFSFRGLRYRSKQRLGEMFFKSFFTGFRIDIDHG